MAALLPSIFTDLPYCAHWASSGKESVRLDRAYYCVAELSVFNGTQGRLGKTPGICKVHARQVNFLKADGDFSSKQLALDLMNHLSQRVAVVFDGFDCEPG